jgi:isoquinoline 1-oxidoreductase subunit alpha
VKDLGRADVDDWGSAAKAAPHWAYSGARAQSAGRSEDSLEIVVNGASRALPDELAPPQMPLLWALRDLLGLTGTKFGCGVAACGACTIHVDGKAVRSCVTPLEAVRGRRVVTIEALGTPERPHPLQQAWVEHQVPQCGYCQSGMLMAAAALLAARPAPSDAEIDAAITNICRCGTYPRIRAAIRAVAARAEPKKNLA